MSDETPSTFVNRRGRTAAVETAEPATQTTPKKSTTPASKRTRQRRIRLPRLRRWRVSGRQRGVIALIAGVMILAGLIMADGVKRDYDRQAAAMRRSVLEAGTTIPSRDMTAAVQVRGLLNKLQASSDCRVHGIDVVSWYGPAKTARQACQSTAATYRSLITILRSLEEFSTYSGEVNNALAAIIALPNDGDYAIASEYAEAWTKATEALRALRPAAGVAALHRTTTDAAAAVATAWTHLQTATAAQDRSGFTAAESELQRAYTELRRGTEAFRSRNTELQQSLSSVAKTLSQ